MPDGGWGVMFEASVKEVLSGVVVYGVHGERGGDVDLSLLIARGGRWWRREDQWGHLCSTADACLCQSGVDGCSGFAADSGQRGRSGAEASRRRRGLLLPSLLHEPMWGTVNS